MLERVYRASRFDEALAKVKRDLGPDAVIISSRQIKLPGLSRGEVEVKAMPQGLAQQNGTLHWQPGSSNAGSMGLLERRLLRLGVPAGAARALAARVRAACPEELSLGESRAVLVRVLREEMVFAPPIGQGRARVVALVGPTGVGKTTTVAKLAAMAALIQELKVGLVSIDQYRIGGAEHLERYADLIGVPMELANDAGSLSTALKRLSDADLVLIDTAGRAPRDKAAIESMATSLHGGGERVEVHLCLAAATHDAEMEAIIERLSALRPVKLTITKLDEAIRCGSIVAAQALSGLPLAYFTIGQRVPEDIEVASPERLAGLLSGEEVN